MSAVQEYDTDALQEHIDSTPILLSRLEQWSRAISTVSGYANGLMQAHANISHDLEKAAKNVSQTMPQFPDRLGPAGVAQQQPVTTDERQPTPANPAVAGAEVNGDSLGRVFLGLQTQLAHMMQHNNQTVTGIKTTVIQPLDSLQVELDKHYKMLRTQGGKGMRDIEKSREVTQKLVESLGRVTSSYGTRTLESKEDPYVLARKAHAAVYDQIGVENTQAEAALNVQQTFASLETHIVDVIRQATGSLEQFTTDFDKAEITAGEQVSTNFHNVDLNKEWAYFNKSNADNLVPDSNYQRNPAHVTFVNMTHQSTQPLIEGTLQRKSTTLKQYHQGYYVVTPSGFLHQFKSSSPHEDSSPELSLFLPDCQLSSNPAEFSFKVAGKDSKKMISTRHKYTFKCASHPELERWYNAIARVTGQTGSFDDPSSSRTSTSPPLTPPVPTEEFQRTSLNSPPQQAPVQQQSPIRSVPAQSVPVQSVPAQQVPAQQVPAQQVPAQHVQTQVPIQQVPVQQAAVQQPAVQQPPAQRAPVQTIHQVQQSAPVEPVPRPASPVYARQAPPADPGHFSETASLANSTRGSSNDPFRSF